MPPGVAEMLRGVAPGLRGAAEIRRGARPILCGVAPGENGVAPESHFATPIFHSAAWGSRRALSENSTRARQERRGTRNVELGTWNAERATALGAPGPGMFWGPANIHKIHKQGGEQCQAQFAMSWAMEALSPWLPPMVPGEAACGSADVCRGQPHGIRLNARKWCAFFPARGCARAYGRRLKAAISPALSRTKRRPAANAGEA